MGQMSEAMLDAEWRAVDERKQETEPALQEAAEAYFQWEREQVVAALEQKRRGWRLEIDISVGDLLSMVRAAQELISRLSDPMIAAIRQGFESGKLRIDAEGPPFDPEAPGVQDVVSQVQDVLEEVPKTSRARLSEIVTDGYAEGKDLDEVIDEVQELYQGATEDDDGMGRQRAKTIARTTSTAAFERGQLHSFQENGIQAKEWLTTRDGRQREGHGEANGQRREAGSPFRVRASTEHPFEDLLHPGDPTASVENVVNCRCSMLPAFGDEQDADTSPIEGVVETEGPS
jgi:hypothetical protein